MDRFSEFLDERKYLLNVSPKTLTYYNCAFKARQVYSGGDPKIWIVNLRSKGASAVSCNTYICAMNAYWKWAGEPLHLSYLKEEEKILATFSAVQVSALLTFKPKGANQTRAHALANVLLDTGVRISEALAIQREDIDLNNMLIRVTGKGNKQRLVPMSLELRRLLFRWPQRCPKDFVFGTRSGTQMTVRNFQRDFKAVCVKLKIADVRCSPNTLRHNFAVSYLRAGGNLFYLSKILGHTSVKTTERYLQNLQPQDHQVVHDRLSLLTRR